MGRIEEHSGVTATSMLAPSASETYGCALQESLHEPGVGEARAEYRFLRFKVKAALPEKPTKSEEGFVVSQRRHGW